MIKTLRNEAWQERLALLAAVFLPLAYMITWSVMNWRLPGSDGGNYAETALEIYHRFQEYGAYYGVRGMFSIRGWRPIIMPTFPTPFMLLSGGNLLFSVSAVSTTGVLLLATYAFLIFRIWLGRWTSVLATIFFAFVPMVIYWYTPFFSEGWMTTASLGMIYHLHRSDFFRQRAHSLAFAFFAFLMCALRPIESLIALFPILSLFWWFGRNRKIFNIPDLILTFSVFSFFAAFFFDYPIVRFVLRGKRPLFPGVSSAQELTDAFYRAAKVVNVGFALFLAAGILVLWACRKRLNPNFIKINALWVFLASLWFVPFAESFWEWIYRTSLGDVARQYLPSIAGSWNYQLHYYGPMIGYPIVICAILGWAARKISREADGLNTSAKEFCLYLCSAFALPLIICLATGQPPARKMSLAIAFLALAILLFALQKGRSLALRRTLAAGLGAIQVGVIWFSLVVPDQSPWISNPFFKFAGVDIAIIDTIRPNKVHPDRNTQLANYLTEAQRKFQFSDVVILLEPPFDFSIVPVILSAAGEKFPARSRFFETYDANLREYMLAREIKWILLSNPFGKVSEMKDAKAQFEQMAGPEEPAVDKRIKGRIISGILNGDLEKIGFELKDRSEVFGRDVFLVQTLGADGAHSESTKDRL